MQINNIDIFSVNNIRILYYPNSSFLTSIQILTRAGSLAEQKDIMGMAHILEHMFFKGSRRRPDPMAISRAANDIGGKMNAYTTYDHTAYFITVLNEKFKEGLDILADMYQHPLFPEDELKKEISPILSELREREDEPEGYLGERALEKFLGDKYHPIIGRPETIEKASIDRLRQFHRTFYGRENMLLVVCGGVKREALIECIENSFQAPQACQVPELPAFQYTPGNLELTRPGLHEAYFHLYYPALPVDHEDRTTEDAMNYILGGNDSSLLFERIREELGLSCYGIYSFTSRFDKLSLAGISCGIDQGQLEILEKEVMGILDRICNDLISQELLERMKAALKTSIAQRCETSDGMASMIGVPVLRGEKDHPVRRALAKIEAVTREDVRSFAARLFSNKPFRAILLPE